MVPASLLLLIVHLLSFDFFEEVGPEVERSKLDFFEEVGPEVLRSKLDFFEEV